VFDSAHELYPEPTLFLQCLPNNFNGCEVVLRLFEEYILNESIDPLTLVYIENLVKTNLRTTDSVDLLLVGINLLLLNTLDELCVEGDVEQQLWLFWALIFVLTEDVLMRINELQGHIEGILHVIPVLPWGQLIGLHDGFQDEEDD
jgi:hypothetical protein